MNADAYKTNTAQLVVPKITKEKIPSSFPLPSFLVSVGKMIQQNLDKLAEPRRSRQILPTTFCVGLLSLSLLSATQAQTNYTVEYIPRVLTTGMTLVALNNGGRVIGTYEWRDHSIHSFTYRNGIKNDLGTFTGYDNKVSAINNCGQIVGAFTKGSWYYPATFVQVAYLRDPNGEVILLGSLDNATRTVPLGINDSGVIVGSSGDNAFVYRNGHMFKLGEYNGQRIFSAIAINNRGQIVALYQGATYVRTLLYSGCQMQDLPVAEGRVEGTGINDHGAVVGKVWVEDSYFPSGFLYAAGQTQILWGFAQTHINNSGQISGYVFSELGDQYPFILGPGPGELNLSGWFGSYGISQGNGVAAGINDSGQIIGYGSGYGTGSALDIAVLMTPLK